MKAPTTFATKKEAQEHLAMVNADRTRGTYIDPRKGERLFGDYAAQWVENGGTRGKLAPKTAELYRDILKRQLDAFDADPLNVITPERVRSWYVGTRKTLAAPSKPSTARTGHPARAWAMGQGIDVAPTGRLAPAIITAWEEAGSPTTEMTRRPASQRRGEARLGQAYRLIHAIMGTAVADGLIAKNPCVIVGAGSVKDPERPYLAPEQLQSIVTAMGAAFDAPMKVMLGGHLRLGELVGLQRGDYDSERRSLRIERQTVVVASKEVVTATKTGQAREVPLPPSVANLLDAHLAETSGFPKSPMFTGKDGRGLSRHALQRAWAKGVKATGLEGYHLHDIRHTGLTLAAVAGASQRELMARAGHRTSRAAGIYQHVAEGRLAVIADRLDALIGGTETAPNGTLMARTQVSANATNPNDIREITA
ncbi:MAG: tyrosine-type recombinase/integrase [Microbacterium sp.]